MIMSGVASMHPLDALKLPAGQPVELKPGGDHIMLMELRHPLRHGDKLPLVITVEDAHGKRSRVEVEARVVPLVE
jgi:copper(I)-binding protein